MGGCRVRSKPLHERHWPLLRRRMGGGVAAASAGGAGGVWRRCMSRRRCSVVAGYVQRCYGAAGVAAVWLDSGAARVTWQRCCGVKRRHGCGRLAAGGDAVRGWCCVIQGLRGSVASERRCGNAAGAGRRCSRTIGRHGGDAARGWPGRQLRGAVTERGGESAMSQMKFGSGR